MADRDEYTIADIPIRVVVSESAPDDAIYFVSRQQGQVVYDAVRLFIRRYFTRFYDPTPPETERSE